MGLTWKNLKENKCPQCWGDFSKTLVTPPSGMIACKCGFQIREQKYSAIISDRTRRREASREDGWNRFNDEGAGLAEESEDPAPSSSREQSAI